MPQQQGRSTFIFNFLSPSNSPGAGPWALGLGGLDWVSGLTFWPYGPGNPTRLKHSHSQDAERWHGARTIALDGEQGST